MPDRTVILAPHHDDVALFTAFNAIRYQAHIIVCLRSVKQERYGIKGYTRIVEERAAARALGCTVEFYSYPDIDPSWPMLSDDIADLDADRIFAPAVEDHGGNEQHNEIGRLALRHHGTAVTGYLTYTTEGKSTWGTTVEFEPAWVPMKLRALACHVSQASLFNCYEHFLRDQHEFTA